MWAVDPAAIACVCSDAPSGSRVQLRQPATIRSRVGDAARTQAAAETTT